jgi:hypothetical protein
VQPRVEKGAPEATPAGGCLGGNANHEEYGPPRRTSVQIEAQFAEERIPALHGPQRGRIVRIGNCKPGQRAAPAPCADRETRIEGPGEEREDLRELVGVESRQSQEVLIGILDDRMEGLRLRRTAHVDRREAIAVLHRPRVVARPGLKPALQRRRAENLDRMPSLAHFEPAVREEGWVPRLVIGLAEERGRLEAAGHQPVAVPDVELHRSPDAP